jgi:hypothetical protein
MTMTQVYAGFAKYHETTDVAAVVGAQNQTNLIGRHPWLWGYWEYSFDFKNFYHPYVGALIRKLNQTDVKGMLNAGFLDQLVDPYAAQDYTPNPSNLGRATSPLAGLTPAISGSCFIISPSPSPSI